MELSLTWINRILFLKLLEGQLVAYHRGDNNFRFLDFKTIHDFDELYKLFHQVLARQVDDRPANIREKYQHVPYLNSSLFEISELEEQSIKINSLDNSALLELMPNSVLKPRVRQKEALLSLDYIFCFLDAYDFASEGNDEIQEDNRTLINASVLGRVFEKINGYKDGSFFTPGFITMYMCRETIRLAVIRKFNERKGWKCETLTDIHNEIIDRAEANEIINSLKICDPSVGSGHYLVSALNEIIAIKAELGILQDSEGKRLKDYNIEIINDEIVMTDEYGDPFLYNYRNNESQRIQKTLFHEKQKIIENCLFGADINPNSVKICRLRLWIELLKNAYYKQNGNNWELETLPNIDINIKCGNSLISRFKVDFNISKFRDIKIRRTFLNAFTNYKLDIEAYRHCYEKQAKDKIRERISWFKTAISELYLLDQKEYKEIKEAESKLGEQSLQFDFGSLSNSSFSDNELLAENIRQRKKDYFTKYNETYGNAIEWRFEFPEVLDNEGNFIGFDILIGNPPYIQLQKMGKDADSLKSQAYDTFTRTGDIYSLFYEQGVNLLTQGGHLCYITSNKWMRAAYGESLRNYFLEKTNPLQLIDFAGLQLFDAATVDTNILLLQKARLEGPIKACIVGKDFERLKNLSVFVRQNSADTDFKAGESWVILTPIEQRIKAKIERIGTPLKDWDIKIYRGVLTGYNEAFIIDGKKKDELIAEDAKSAEIIRPILRGRDIKRYGYEFANLWLINTHNGNKEKNMKPVNIDDYPAIKRHLDLYHSEIVDRADKGYTAYNLRNCAYMDDFSKQKIVWGEISDKTKFCIDKEGKYFTEATTFLLTGKSLLYLLGYLNSRLSEYIFSQIGTTTGVGTIRWKKYTIEQLKVPIIPMSRERLYEAIVLKLIAEKADEKNYDSLRQALDNMIYEDLCFQQDEIEFIENQ